MAVLSNQDRFDTMADVMRDARMGATAALTKANLRSALDALDDFMNTNAATINNAIPLPARTALTAAQKAMLLMYVVSKRYLAGS